ncbi:MAG: glycosyltransferase family 2 protein [Betaproteobacteria bacterium]|nr:glycosyltransferase family 2 protein [Betaproteobacteria bacterium]
MRTDPPPPADAPELSVVLPARNEAANLAMLVPEVAQVLGGCSASHEIIVVDDGSTDTTRDAMAALAARQPGLRYVRLARNFGKELAITAGLHAARGRAVVIMDSDGQHPPGFIPTLVAKWREGVQMVYTVQTARRESALVRVLKKLFYRVIDSASGTPIPPNAGDFRLLDRALVDVLKAMPERNRFMKGLYGWPGFRSEGIAFEVAERRAGASHYGFMRLMRLGIVGLTAFSVVPLRMVSLAGLVISLGAMLFGLNIVFEYFVGGIKVPGFATLAVGIAFLSGIQLMALGILAEYVGRVYEEVKQRPLYVVAESWDAAALHVPAVMDANALAQPSPRVGA